MMRMSCPKCGTATAPGAAFCAVCGTNLAGGVPPPMPIGMPYGVPPPMMAVPMQQRTSGMAIAGFVLSFFCSLLGLIFSIMGRNECKRSNGMVGGDGLAIAGIVISSIGMVIWLIYVIAIVAFMGSHHSSMYSY
jgi:uncharacterized protein with PQ loop repeat